MSPWRQSLFFLLHLFDFFRRRQFIRFHSCYFREVLDPVRYIFEQKHFCTGGIPSPVLHTKIDEEPLPAVHGAVITCPSLQSITAFCRQTGAVSVPKSLDHQSDRFVSPVGRHVLSVPWPSAIAHPSGTPLLQRSRASAVDTSSVD
jgi:hypothetical protein